MYPMKIHAKGFDALTVCGQRLSQIPEKHLTARIDRVTCGSCLRIISTQGIEIIPFHFRKEAMKDENPLPPNTSYRIHHKVKCWPAFFASIYAGQKTHEIRINDRDYQSGHVVRLLEYEPSQAVFTGAVLDVLITYLATECPGLQPGYCVFSFSLLRAGKDDGDTAIYNTKSEKGD